MIRILLVVNFCVYAVQWFIPGFSESIALYPVDDAAFRWYQVLTHMFAHATYFIPHLLLNMIVLWSFGRLLEWLWGAPKFLLFYILCGLGSAAMHLLAQAISGSAEAAVGASGAIMGLLAAFARLFPDAKWLLFFIIPVRAKWAVLAVVVLDLLGAIVSYANDPMAHFAHLGGAVTGYMLARTFHRTGQGSNFQ